MTYAFAAYCQHESPIASGTMDVEETYVDTHTPSQPPTIGAESKNTVCT